MKHRSVSRVANIEGFVLGILSVASYAGCSELTTFSPGLIALVVIVTFTVTFLAARTMARQNFESSKPYIERDWRTVDLWTRMHLSRVLLLAGAIFIACILLTYWDRPFKLAVIAPVIVIGATWFFIPYLGDMARHSWREDVADTLREGISKSFDTDRPPTQGTRFNTRQAKSNEQPDSEFESDLDRLRRKVNGE